MGFFLACMVEVAFLLAGIRELVWNKEINFSLEIFLKLINQYADREVLLSQFLKYYKWLYRMVVDEYIHVSIAFCI